LAEKFFHLRVGKYNFFFISGLVVPALKPRKLFHLRVCKYNFFTSGLVIPALKS